MATIQDVQNAIDAAAAARVAETSATTALTAIEAVVDGALTAESAAYGAAFVAWTTALDAAREVSGFPPALAARDAAALARAQAENDARQVMADYLATPSE